MSYNVYIADDEPMIRYGIASSVQWSDYHLNVVGEAGNGQAALDYMTNHHVDILITDIKMPIMDGLTLISHAKEINPHIQAILISSYNEFDYAREAVKLGVVVDYLLKPTMEPEHLIKSITLCVKKLEQLHHNELLEQQVMTNKAREQQQQIQTNIFEWLVHEKAPSLQSIPEWFSSPIMLASWHCNDTKQLQLVSFMIENQFENHVQLYLYTNHLLTIVSNYNQSAAAHYELIYSRVNEEINSLFTIVSTPVPDWRKLPTTYNLLESNKEQQFYIGKCGLLQLTKQAPIKKNYPEDMNSNEYKFNNFKENILQAISSNDALLATTNAQYLFTMWRERLLSKKEVIKQAQSLLSLIYTIRLPQRSSTTIQYIAEQLKQIEQIEFLESLIQFIEHEFLELWQSPIVTLGESEHDHSPSIQHAIAYIHETYREQLSLQKVADYVHMSKNYFSEQFKKKTGMNYMDFVIRLRIQYAKQLLATTIIKVHDIGERSGFNSPKHFLKLFKRETGLTPLEYRQHYTKQTEVN